MSDEQVTTPKGYGRRLEFFQSKNFYSYLVCLMIAATFWLLNALTKTYTTSLDLPISYSNFPTDEILISDLPEKAKIEVESFGFNLLSYKLSHIGDSIYLDVDKARKSRSSLNQQYALTTTPALSELMNYLPSEIRLKRIMVDTVYFETQKLGEKLIPVIPQLDLSYDKQHMQEADITIKPEMVKVTGAVSILNSVMEAKLKPLKLSGLNNDISVEIAFLPLEGVNLEIENAVVYIPVDQMTEKEMELDIQIQNLPDSTNVRLFPKQVKVTVQVPVSRYNEIGPEDFEFVVDYASREVGKSSLYVKADRIARFCRVANYEPLKAEFVISK